MCIYAYVCICMRCVQPLYVNTATAGMSWVSVSSVSQYLFPQFLRISVHQVKVFTSSSSSLYIQKIRAETANKRNQIMDIQSPFSTKSQDLPSCLALHKCRRVLASLQHASVSVLPVIKKKCTPFRIPPLFIAPLDLTFIAHLSPIARQKPNTGNVFLNEVLDVPRFPGVVQIEGRNQCGRATVTVTFLLLPSVTSFFHLAVGRTIERVQPGKLVGLLDLEFTHPRRLFALHLFSFSSQSSAVRYREPIKKEKTREKSRFLAFPATGS